MAAIARCLAFVRRINAVGSYRGRALKYASTGAMSRLDVLFEAIGWEPGLGDGRRNQGETDMYVETELFTVHSGYEESASRASGLD